MNEEWKPIDGFEGYYEVSNLGRVRSLDRRISRLQCGSLRYVRLKGRVLRPTANTPGYLQVSLCVDGEMTPGRVHQLVARAFVPNPEGLPQPNHRDGNKLNNRADNFEWLTQSGNSKHACETGLWEPLLGDAHGMAKLKTSDVQEIRHRAAVGECQADLARLFVISKQSVSNIVMRKSWAHI